MSILPIGCCRALRARALRARAPRRWPPRALGVSWRLPLLLLLLPLATGCGDQSLRPDPKPEPADLYWSLALNHHAVALDTMAPYDTLQLVATPKNYRDEPLAGLPAAQYRSDDPERVAVLPDGQVIALAATAQPVAIVATLTVNNLKHADTALVSVVATTTPPPVLDRFSIQPVPPDSAKVSASTSWLPVLLPLRAATAGGDPIPVYGRDAGGYLPVDFRSSDTTIARVFSDWTGIGWVRGRQPGSVTINASTTAFGVRKADTLVYRVGHSIFESAFITSRVGTKIYTNQQPSITIGVGGVVAWSFVPTDSTDTLDVTFAEADFPNIAVPQPGIDWAGLAGWFCANPAQCSGANFLLSASQQFDGRYFPTPGTYEYRSVRLGLTGRVVVVDER